MSYGQYGKLLNLQSNKFVFRGAYQLSKLNRVFYVIHFLRRFRIRLSAASATYDSPI
jgi:hypothetical protein